MATLSPDELKEQLIATQHRLSEATEQKNALIRQLEMEDMIEAAADDSEKNARIKTELDRIDAEIQTVEAEKKVHDLEAEKHGAEVLQLRGALERLEARLNELEEQDATLEDETEGLRLKKEMLAVEIHSAQGETKNVQSTIKSLENEIKEAIALRKSVVDATEEAKAEARKIEEEAGELQIRVRNVEGLELAAGCMAAAVRRTVHVCDVLLDGLKRGGEFVDEEEDDYNSEDDADYTTDASYVVSSARASAVRCSENLGTIRSEYKRIIDQEQEFLDAAAKKRNEVVEAASQEFYAQRREHNEELKVLHQKVAYREEQRDFFKTMRRALLAQEGLKGTSDINLVRMLREKVRALIRQKDDLELECASLEKKAENSKQGFKDIKELKDKYRVIETKKINMFEDMLRLEDEVRLKRNELLSVRRAGSYSDYRETVEQAGVMVGTPKKKASPWKVNVGTV